MKHFFKFFNLILILTILFGASLRFYKLNWGDDLFTHPDEYHIVISVNQLSFPDQLNPHFFNYGSVTIYLIYFTKFILSQFGNTEVNIFLLGRFFSALFSTLTLIFIFKITLRLLSKIDDRQNFHKIIGLVTTFIAATTPGLIQQAHFATPESALIFFIMGTTYFILKYLDESSIKNIILTSIFFGLSLGVKVSSSIMLLPIGISILIKQYKNLFILFKQSILFFLLAFVTLFIVAPFIFLDFKEFQSSLIYEGSLATGSLPVFYTRQFIDTIPILFQLEKIYPFALGPVLLVLSLIGIIYSFYFAIKKRELSLIIFSLTFLTVFIINSYLFTKWTRFISPTFPYLSIFTGLLIYQFLKLNFPKKIIYLIIFIFLFFHLIWTISFFSIYQQPDVRIRTSNWILSNLPRGSSITVEGGNMVDVPVSGNYLKTSLDLYPLEDSQTTKLQLVEALEKNDYFIIESRRMFANHQRLPNLYPFTKNFYDLMFKNEHIENPLGYKNIMEFNSYPNLNILGFTLIFSDEKAEETWSVFDHPVIRIYKNLHTKTKEDYLRLLGV